jgi:hypothetical protein
MNRSTIAIGGALLAIALHPLQGDAHRLSGPMDEARLTWLSKSVPCDGRICQVFIGSPVFQSRCLTLRNVTAKIVFSDLNKMTATLHGKMAVRVPYQATLSWSGNYLRPSVRANGHIGDGNGRWLARHFPASCLARGVTSGRTSFVGQPLRDGGVRDTFVFIGFG